MNESAEIMKGAQGGLKSARSWHVVWAALLLLSANNATTTHAIAKWVLLASVAVGAIALAQATHWLRVVGRRETALSWCVFAMFCCGQLLHFGIVETVTSAKYGFDFSAYYLAGKVVQERQAESLYDLPLLADGRMNLHTEDSPGSAWTVAARRYSVPYSAPYIYPPFFAVLMIPFAHLSFAGALAAWNGVSLLLAAAAVWLGFDVAGVRMNGRLALLSGVGLLSFYPFIVSLYCGQIGGAILFFFAACVWLLSRGQVWLSALCLALATLIKLTPVLAVPLLVIHRRWRWLAAYAVWMVALAAISMRVTGWTSYMEFWHRALPAIGCGSAVWENTSIVAWVQELFLRSMPQSTSPSATIPMYACQISKLVAMAIYGVFLLWYWLRRREQSVERGIVAVSLLSLAISPISWWHHYTIAVLPLVYLWCTMRDRVSRALLAALALVAGTNVVGLIGLVWFNSAALLVLAAVTPMLAIAVAFAAIGKRQVFVTITSSEMQTAHA